MDFLIRKAEKDDAGQIQDVAGKSWHATYEGIIPGQIQDRFLSAAYSDEMMEKRIDESVLFVAEKDNKVVGFANFSTVNDEGQVELGAIYLYPDFQGAGIGTELLRKGMKTIGDVKEVYVDVEKENTIGRTFYEAKGFETVKEFDDNFDGHILKTVRMVLRL